MSEQSGMWPQGQKCGSWKALQQVHGTPCQDGTEVVTAPGFWIVGMILELQATVQTLAFFGGARELETRSQHVSLMALELAV